MAESLNNSVSPSMPSLLPPKQEQESAPITIVAATESLELFKNEKKKRGRPRKDDSNRDMILTSRPPKAESWTMTMSFSSPLPPPPGFTFSPPPPPLPPKPHSRYGGAGSAVISGGSFTPHLLNVFAGQDIAGKIMSFVEKGPRAVCILSATGTISKATICRVPNSDQFWTYEGRFKILTLSGSYAVMESGDMMTGGLSVVLECSGSDVFGGRVAGLLTAAGPVQIVVGSFRPHASKRKRSREEHTTSQLVVAEPIAVCTDTMAATNLASQANPKQSQREFAAANDSEEFPDQKISPYINKSLSDV
ncbi:hypothetical protein PIB30_048505 [Stylosanthes scabra]|uniref:AT-hook motif nuclear-localized protein n=1 Tax=Stylosanthes scabra TaxID=79078 RepID=A0ABU6UFT8_9FABA|nr:hypothetical protein [Stylosanthes scabra]